MIKRVEITDEQRELDNAIFLKKKFNGVEPSPIDERDYDVKKVGLKVCKKKGVAGSAQEYPEEYEAPQTPILNQGYISSCVAHALATALASGEKTAVAKEYNYSRGYIYGNRAEGDYQGEGMSLRQALSQLNKCGDVEYEDFPYNNRYNYVKGKIEEKAEKLARKAAENKIINYFRCYSEEEIKAAVMKRGGCVVCVPVYSDFSRNLEETKTNVFSGYHAMIIVGWTAEGYWVVQNSWGKGWGYEGKLLMNKNYPVDEYWGITVKDYGTPEDKKVNRFVEFLKMIINFWKNVFCRKKNK